ncbi:MAG: hypothetical protein AAFY47_03765 [Pseudomonadota bacterium]
MIYIWQNLIAILAATGAGLALGLLGVRLSKSLLPNGRALFIVAVSEFWLASILAGALILAPPQAPALIMVLATPVVIWIGFVVPVIAVQSAVQEISLRSTVLTGLHWLVVMLAMAGVLEYMGLSAPGAA